MELLKPSIPFPRYYVCGEEWELSQLTRYVRAYTGFVSFEISHTETCITYNRLVVHRNDPSVDSSPRGLIGTSGADSPSEQLRVTFSRLFSSSVPCLSPTA